MHSPPSRKRVTALVGMSVLALTNSPVRAGFEAEHPAAMPIHPVGSCTNSTRSVRQLAMIDHTSDGGFQCIGVYVEGNTVKAIRLERHNLVFRGGRQNAEEIKVAEFPPDIIDSAQGAVVDGIPGHDAIILRGHLSNPAREGRLVLAYLYNGLTGEYRSCSIGLDWTLDAGWRLVNRLDQPISLIMVRIRQLPVIGTVGIANLEGACA